LRKNRHKQLPFHVAFSQLFLYQSEGIPFGGGRVEECLGFALAFRADSAEADDMLVSTDANLPEFVRTASNKLETAFPLPWCSFRSWAVLKRTLAPSSTRRFHSWICEL